MGVVQVETLSSPSIDRRETDFTFEATSTRESWMTPYRDYIERGVLPERRSEKRQVLRKASRFVIQNGIMYRRGYSVLSSGVSRTMKSDEYYAMYTKENVAITLGGKRSQRKYFDMGIIGLLLIAMLQTMLKNVTNARNTLEFLEPRLLR